MFRSGGYSKYLINMIDKHKSCVFTCQKPALSKRQLLNNDRFRLKRKSSGVDHTHASSRSLLNVSLRVLLSFSPRLLEDEMGKGVEKIFLLSRSV